MTVRRILLIQAVLVTVLQGIAGAQEAASIRVGVLSFVSLESDDRYDVVVSQVTDTVSLTLQLLPGYTPEVIDTTTSAGFDTAVPLRELAAQIARERRFDAVFFGTAERTERGTLFRAGVYNPATSAVSVSVTGEAASLLAVFETADQLVVDLLQEFSGRTIRFGSLAVSTTPGSIPVGLRFGGNTIEPRNGRVENVLVGPIDVSIIQDRFEPGTVIAEQTIEVIEGRTTTIEVEIPGLTAAEENYLFELERRIDENHRFAARDQDVASAIDELTRAVGGAEFSPAIPLLRERVAEISDLWEVQRVAWGIPYLEDADATVALAEILPIFDDPEASPAVRAAAAHTVVLYAETQYLAAYEKVAGRRWDAVSIHFDRIEQVRAHVPIERYREITESRNRLGRMREDYTELEDAGSGLWPWIVAGAGAAALGTAGVLMITDPVGKLSDENDDLYEEYRTASTSDQRNDIRSEMDANEIAAQRYRVIQWASLGTGTVALGTGILGIVRSSRAPSRYFRDYVYAAYGGYIEAARAFFSDSSEAVAVATGTDRDVTVVIGDATPQSTPAYAENDDLAGNALNTVRVLDGDADATYPTPINRGRNLFVTYLPSAQPLIDQSRRLEWVQN